MASTMAPSPSPNSNEEGSRITSSFSPSMSVPLTTMKGGPGDMGSGGGGSATMERSKLSFVMPTPVVQSPKLDDGGSGGDIGKNNRNGGGGGGGDDDDDDYFGADGDGDGDGEGEGQKGTGFFRAVIPESYDKLFINAVLAEWMKTLQELPAILRQAVGMGLFSSAQLVRFFAMDVRPSLTRSISRSLPPSVARDFVGRLMADPGFVQKLVMEGTFATAASLFYECRARGDKIKEEWDLALINTLGMAAATTATVWMLAPSRSYGSLHKFPWQQMLDGLPNCVFDVSGPLRQYSKQARAVGFMAKMAELSMVGAMAGGLTSLLSQAAVSLRQQSSPEWRPSVEVPSFGRSSAGMAAFFALNANIRYQLIGGLDRFLFDRTTFLWTYTALSGAGRLVSNQAGELSRPWWQGLPTPSALQLPSLPDMMPRRIKKKVSKKVPRSQIQQRQAAREEQAAALALSSGPALMSLDQVQEPVSLPEQESLAAHAPSYVDAGMEAAPQAAMESSYAMQGDQQEGVQHEDRSAQQWSGSVRGMESGELSEGSSLQQQMQGSYRSDNSQQLVS